MNPTNPTAVTKYREPSMARAVKANAQTNHSKLQIAKNQSVGEIRSISNIHFYQLEQPNFLPSGFVFTPSLDILRGFLQGTGLDEIF